MTNYVFPGPAIDASPPNLPIIREAVQKLRDKQSLTITEAHALLHGLVMGALGGLEPEPEILEGKCGLTQSWGFYASRDVRANLRPRPFAIQSLEPRRRNHVAYTLKLPVEENKTIFLLDPTFRQFCNPKAAFYLPPYDQSEPGILLSRERPEILNRLLTQGYLELTPSIAASYLRCFCGGKSPFAEDSQAVEFLRNPPKNRVNLVFGRQELAARGYPVRIPEEILAL